MSSKPMNIVPSQDFKQVHFVPLRIKNQMHALNGRPLTKQDVESWRAIIAAKEGNTGALIAAIEAGADLTRQDEKGYTALHYAAATTRGGVRALVASGRCDYFIKDFNGQSVIEAAPPDAISIKRLFVKKIKEQIEARGYPEEVLFRTFQKLGDPTSEFNGRLVALRDDGRPAINGYWMAPDQRRMLCYLFRQETSPETTKVSELQLSAVSDDRSKALLTVGQGDKSHVLGQRLLIAAKTKKPEEVALLIANGANVNTQDDYGLTPLHHAAVKGSWPCVQLLVASRKCNYLIRDYADRTASQLCFKVRSDDGIGRYLMRHEKNTARKTGAPREIIGEQALIDKYARGSIGPYSPYYPEGARKPT